MPTSKNLIGINTGENIVVNDNANLEPMMAKPIKFEQTNFNQSQIAKAAFERENTAVSSILEASYQLKFDNETDPNFDISEVIDGDIKGSKYEPYLDNFLEFKNPNQVKALKDKIDKEDENTKILDESGWTGVAWSLAAGILDPVNFIPIGGGAYKAYKAGKVAKGIALTAGAGTVGATTSEGILQATQETRTIEESIINIAGATLLAGVLGGSAAYISKRKFNNLAKKVEKDVEIETADIQINPETQKVEIKPETATAKNVEELDAIKKYYNDILTPQLKAEGKEIPTFADFRKQQQSLISTITQDIAGAVKGEKVLKKINLIDNLNPIQRLTQTQYATAPKEVAEKLMKTGLMWNKNKIGIASAQSAEISKKALQASYFNAYKPLEKKAFYNFQKRIKKEGSKNATEENIVKSSSFTEKLDKKLFGGSSEKFYEELSRALRNGDVSNVPEIEQLAKTARSEVISKLGKEAVNVGLLDEKILTTKPKTAESYFPRMWNKQKVIAKENELKDFLTTAIKERLLPNIKNKEANKELALNSQILDLQTKKLELENRFEKASENKANESQQNAIQNAFNKKFDGIINENLYIENVVDEIISKLKGEDRLGLIDDLGIKVGSRGPLKERTLNFVQDNELEPWLENDASKVLNYYQNTLATDIEVARAFEGDLTLDNEIAKINEEYKNAKKGITDPKILKNIEKERIRVINDVDSTLKIMRGMYARPDDPDSLIVRGGRLVRQFNYITKMGQVAISSISDISNPIRKHGLATWAKTLPNLITNLKGIKLNVKEAKLAGNITDRIMPERMASFSGLGDPFASSSSSFERVVDNIGKFMSKINLMPLWNDSQKSFSSVVSQQRMVKAINKYDKVDEKEITYLSYLGIGRDNYQIIANELKQYAYKEDGLWVANTEKWQNTEAVRIYRNALNTDVDSTIVSVGAGDLPLWMQTEVGKVVGQFKSFTFGATQQVLASGLQQKDMAVLNGLISATALGMMIYYFKRKLSGKELSDDPAVWINEGLDRSGYFGILAEYSHIADKVGLGFSTLSGAGQLSRYQTRSAATSLLGPSVGAVSDAFIGGSALISQEITEADAKAIRRMIPLNNTLILTKAMDNFEKSIANK
jgi:hypothetical protein